MVVKCEVLVSTMNCRNSIDLVKRMNIQKGVIINQVTEKNMKLPMDTNDSVKMFSYNEKGLSKSRNKAILHSNADVCIIADDDLCYVNNYESIVKKAYLKYPDADIIAFSVIKEHEKNDRINLKEGKVNLFQSMKISSVRLTFRRKSIIENKLAFDENFGAGTELYCGEENIFLFDAFRKKMKVYYVPIRIATLKESKSSWFTGFDERFFRTFGAIFYRMNQTLSLLLTLQFTIRKRKIYKKNYSSRQVLLFLLKGRKNYKEKYCDF